MTDHFTCKVSLGVSQLASVIQSTVVLNNPNNLIEVLCATLLDSGANDLSRLLSPSRIVTISGRVTLPSARSSPMFFPNLSLIHI